MRLVALAFLLLFSVTCHASYVEYFCVNAKHDSTQREFCSTVLSEVENYLKQRHGDYGKYLTQIGNVPDTQHLSYDIETLEPNVVSNYTGTSQCNHPNADCFSESELVTEITSNIGTGTCSNLGEKNAIPTSGWEYVGVGYETPPPGWQEAHGRGRLAKRYDKQYELDTTYYIYYNNPPPASECEGPYKNTSEFTLIKYENYTCLNTDYYPYLVNGVPQCDIQNVEDTVYIDKCYAPYEFDAGEKDCVKWCPPDASILDKIFGRCKTKPGDANNKQCAVAQGNPIFTDTGEKVQLESPDFIGSGAYPLSFARNYRSYRVPEVKREAIRLPDDSTNWVKYVQPEGYKGISSGLVTRPFSGTAGFKQWQHNYQLSLAAYEDLSKVALHRSNDSLIYFSKQADDITYLPDNLTGGKVIKQESTWKFMTPQGNVEIYNELGQLISLQNEQGLSQQLTYNEDGHLISIADPAGRTLVFSYDESGRLTRLTTPNNSDIRYIYGSHGNLIQVIYPDETENDITDNPKTQYGYADVNYPYALTTIIDANNDINATWTYDNMGRANSSSNNSGHKYTSIDYDGYDAKVTYANNKQTTLKFDNKGRLDSVSGENCGECSDANVQDYQYDANNQLVAKVDGNGNTTRYAYNDKGQQISKIEAYGTNIARETKTQWHAEFPKPIQITTPTLQIDYEYGANGELLRETQTDLLVASSPVRETTYSYNEAGLLAAINGPRTDVNDITTFTYDENFELLTITDGQGNSTSITSRTTAGYPASIIDANGTTTVLEYDVRNRLVKQTVESDVISFSYDDIGQLTAITYPSGVKVNYAYTGSRLLSRIYDDQGNAILYTYDLMGNLIKTEVKDPTQALFLSQQQVFDGLNRLTSIIDGNNNETRYQYDNNGNLINTKSPLLRDTLQIFDALNRVSETIDADGGKVTYSYNAANKLTTVTAQNQATTSYQYNGFGDLIHQTSPDTGLTSFTYDNAGNVLSKTDSNNVTTSYSYDALNRLTNISYLDTSLNVTFEYDNGINAKGHLVKISDGSGSTQYSYDSKGQVTQKISVISGKAFITKYDYDADGNLEKIVLPSTKEIRLTYSGGKASSVSSVINGVTKTLLSDAKYVPFGGARSFTLGNGKSTSYTYDLSGAVSSINVDQVYQTNITYDQDKNITQLVGQNPQQGTQTFTYDKQSRLMDASGGYGTIQYSYDSSGNRQSKTHGDVTSTLAYKAGSNQLTAPFLHDANGNRTQDQTRTYKYGENNRLSEVTTEDGIKTSYVYNALGQRVKKDNIFGVIYFVYNEEGLLIAEADEQGKVTKEYVYFEGKPLAMLVGE